jgi:hypothetical protein
MEKLEAKTTPMSDFEQRRLKQMKLAIKEMDEVGDITIEVLDPSGRRVVCKAVSVKPSDLDADGNFTGRK